jgi:hypothetical protein
MSDDAATAKPPLQYPIKMMHAAGMNMIPMNDALLALLDDDKFQDRPASEAIAEYQRRAAVEQGTAAGADEDEDEDEDEDDDEEEEDNVEVEEKKKTPLTQSQRKTHRIYWVDAIGQALYLMCGADSIDVREEVEAELLDDCVDLDQVMRIATQQFKAIKKLARQQVP